MNNFILLSLIPVLETAAYWKLEWSDEFDKNVIDQDNWEIDDAQNIGRLNCFTNSSKNLRLIDGTLAITAIYEKHLNKKYTSAWIKTKKNFSYGRIDIRAALPVAKMLSPWIKLVPPKYKNKDGFVRQNQIIVFYNDQSNDIKYGVSFVKKFGNIDDFRSNGKLNNFHTYSIEWNETNIIWKFDGFQTNSLNLNGTSTFLKDPVVMTFYLRVGGQPFKNGALVLEDVYDWECSLLILDYVQYYQWHDEDEVGRSELDDGKNRTSVDFCKNLMDEIQPKKDGSIVTQMSLVAIISAVSLIILLALIPLIAWLVIRMKTIKNNSGHKTADDVDYYDDINQMEMYEEIAKETNYDYADPYQLEQRNNNYYEPPVQGNIPTIVFQNMDNDYITMVGKSPRHSHLKIDEK